MKTLIKLFLAIVIFSNMMIAQTSKKNYEYHIDLLHMSNDEVKVSFAPQRITLHKVNLLFPSWFPDFIRR
ncbi:hypothetical protein [Chryseobacterium sp. MEBOG07]|uniref:hypothetical protein n=1 Tax=Chryseobacterium sp. MEBOG07 TaxID=2879939 RepID=UPI001F34C505|nr:hypothetical protein [Chryseobacterium sp. MEBOG07]UKB81092.1 hypothetical protein LF886_08930 [Chryseobacterium sp. MEBOG07]